MRYLPIFLFLLLAFSCKQARKPTSGSTGDSNLPLDSLVYEQLLAKFDLKFSEIEKEYKSATDSRELELDALYEKVELEMVDPVQQNREDYVKLEALIDRMELVEAGKIAPDFEMNNGEGDPVRLSSLYTQSKFLLVDFWASTCGPCRIENVHIRSAYDRFQNEGFDPYFGELAKLKT